jgi:copper chaperone CopZ
MDQNWQATGLTCDHCAQSITKNLMGISGMQSVSIEVHPEAASSISTHGAREFSAEEISFAMRQAGRYILAK